MQFADGHSRRGHIHQSERAQGDIERFVDAQVLGVATGDVDVRQADSRGPALEVGNHLRSEIGCEYTTSRRDTCSGGECCQTCAAGDVDDVLTGLHIGRRQHEIDRRLQLCLPILLVSLRGAVPSLSLHPSLKFRFHLRPPPDEWKWFGSANWCG